MEEKFKGDKKEMGEIMIGWREEWCGFYCLLFWGFWIKDRMRYEYLGMISLFFGGGLVIIVFGVKLS